MVFSNTRFQLPAPVLAGGLEVMLAPAGAAPELIISSKVASTDRKPYDYTGLSTFDRTSHVIRPKSGS